MTRLPRLCNRVSGIVRNKQSTIHPGGHYQTGNDKQQQYHRANQPIIADFGAWRGRQAEFAGCKHEWLLEMGKVYRTSEVLTSASVSLSEFREEKR